jgi:hypothetical protein
MNIFKFEGIFRIIMILSMVPLLAGCGGGGGGGGTGGPPIPPENIIDVSGNWASKFEVTIGGCHPTGQVDYYTGSITQNDKQITMTFNFGDSISTEINGNKITFTSTSQRNDGTATSKFDLTVSDDGSSFTGTQSLSWSNGSDSCSETVSITGTKIPENCTTLDLNGNWQFTVTRPSGPDQVSTQVITQTGNIYQGTWHEDVENKDVTAYGIIICDTIQFSFISQHAGDTITAKGKINGDSMSGTWTSNNETSGTWSAKRI